MDYQLFYNRPENRNNCDESVTIFGKTGVGSSYFLCTIIGLLSFVTVCGNLLVMIAVIYFRQLHGPTHYLILSLAVADLLVGVVVFPFSAALIVNPCMHLQTLICHVQNSCNMFLSATSTLNLCFISVDRYYAVCQPLKYRAIINVRVTVGMILVIWTLPVLIGIGIIANEPNQIQSETKCILLQNPSVILLILATIVFFFLPAVIIFTTNLKTLIVAQRQARAIKKTTCLSKKPAVSKMKRKATKTLSIVIGLFFMCWTPFFFSMTLNPLMNYTIPPFVIECFKWLGWSNSMLNPFVYALFYSCFRSAFRMIISGQIFRDDFRNYKFL